MGKERKSRVDGTVHESMSSSPTKRHRNNSADVNGNAITYPQEIDPIFVTNVNTNSSLNQSEGIRIHDQYPPGYRFCPFESELIIYYLQKKVNNEPMPYNMIKDVNIYKHNPAYLAGQYPVLGEKEWYFYTPRDRKYPNGNRPNRAAGDGYWKATGADKDVKHRDDVVGHKKTLVFYQGKPPHGEKSNWIMHEFRVNGPPRTKEGKDDMRLDDWTLCRIYHKDANKKDDGLATTTSRSKEDWETNNPEDYFATFANLGNIPEVDIDDYYNQSAPNIPPSPPKS